MREIILKTVIYSKADRALDICDVWGFENDELNQLGQKALEILNNHASDINVKYHDLNWTAQSILEFQDLQNTTIPIKGKFIQQNYCFYESLNQLRESFLCGINSCYSASFSCFRSALELLLLHLFWEQKKHSEKELRNFYNWLEGKKAKPTFSQLLAFAEDYYSFPKEWSFRKEIKDLYSKLCSYAHAPLLNESVVFIRGTITSSINNEVLEYWISIAYEVAQVILKLLIIAYPQCLFPVDILKKFGFNTPIGAFFDKYNIVPLVRAIGQENWDKLTKTFSHNKDIKAKLEWYNQLKDLTVTEILLTWDSNDGEIPTNVEEIINDDIFNLISSQKAKSRLMTFALAYWSPDFEVDSISSKEILINYSKYLS